MKAQAHGFSGFGAEFFLHQLRPNTPGGAKFRHFFQQVIVGVEKEGQAFGKDINVHSRIQGRFHIFNTVGQSKSNFLCGSGTGFTNMIAGNTDGVPFGYFFGAIVKNIGDQTQRWFRRENIGAPGNIFFQNIILYRALDLVFGNPLLFRHSDVKGQQYGSRRIDGHGSGDFVQWYAVKQNFHIFEGVNGNTNFSHFTDGFRRVGIIADLGR